MSRRTAAAGMIGGPQVVLFPSITPAAPARPRVATAPLDDSRPPADPYRQPARVLPRVRRAPPPIEDDSREILIGLVFVLAFIWAVC
jgi:hypothetical protein